MGEVLYPDFRSKFVNSRMKNRAVISIINAPTWVRLTERIVRDGYISEDHFLSTLIERELGLAPGGSAPLIKVPDERA